MIGRARCYILKCGYFFNLNIKRVPRNAILATNVSRNIHTKIDKVRTDYQSVSDAYAEKSVLVTGWTGFVGKVVVEKLLYSCPKISKVFVLTRDLPNTGIEERVHNIISLPAFNRIRKERPQDLNKIIPVAGDIAVPNLGLRPKDKETIMNEVSMVFHIAANIKLNDSIQDSLKVNYIGTKRVLEICHQISNIKAFIYMSTAYSNPTLDIVEEKLYQPNIPLEKADQLAQQAFISKGDTLKYLGNTYNSYTLAKNLAENYVAKYHGDIPAAIIRPSIVLPSKAEPLTGWIDIWSNFTVTTTWIAQGLNRTLLTDKKHVIDIIPVDFVANAAIVAVAKLKRSEHVPIYNVCTSMENPVTMGEVIRRTTESGVKYEFGKNRFQFTVLTLSKRLFDTICFIQKQYAMLADGILYMRGLPPRYMETHSKIVHALAINSIFTQRTWTIAADNTRGLFESLSDTDKNSFDFNLKNIVWVDYISSYMYGIKKFMLK